MPAAAFTLDENTNSADNGAAYDIFSTDDAPVRGQVFTDMAEHSVTVDGRVESRPAVVFRFFGLDVDGHRLGNPCCTAKFHPSWTGSALITSLDEPGFLTVQLSQRITAVGDTVAQLVNELVTAIAVDFLTDERVARHRHWLADQRRLNAIREHEHAEGLEQQAFHRFREARAAADASYALLRSVRQQS
ncbi:hypothetical protein OHB12_05185 [Nocardia sp. NBC_01730]|uniref:hypothetical protein n=1 Tax=Nocardia sp. NBC_01730 TaxID=2975998 RepID=UPI002E14CD0C|nr:hypothetical protein OHB12_05185 [Nocardia sp. NBC_01730]